MRRRSVRGSACSCGRICADGRDVKRRCALISDESSSYGWHTHRNSSPRSRLEHVHRAQAQESIYCSESWLNLLTRLYGYSLIPLTAKDAKAESPASFLSARSAARCGAVGWWRCHSLTNALF